MKNIEIMETSLMQLRPVDHQERHLTDTTRPRIQEEGPQVHFEENPAPRATKPRSFIESNTTQVSLDHLANECIIPVFRDNEKTVSHFEFVSAVGYVANQFFNGAEITPPDIRVSHQINGRIPQALNKRVDQLEDWEKTRYYERMMFIMEIPSITEEINGNRLNLTIGGVRALNHESLFSKKSIEKFKVFIGFQNLVCCNLMVSTDGAALDLRVGSPADLMKKVLELLTGYSATKHLRMMRDFARYHLSEHQFAQLIGKTRLYNHLPGAIKKELPMLDFTDSQINTIAHDYYHDGSFCRLPDGNIDLWRLYGLFTGSNKSSYIDTFLNRAVSATSFTQGIVKAIEGDDSFGWFIN